MQALSPTNAYSPPTQESSARTGQGGSPVAATADSAITKPVDALSQQAVPATAAAVDAGKLKESVQKVNEAVKAMGRNLEFSVDDETRISVVKVMDTQTHEVIKQIPSEEVLQIAKALDQLQGLLIKDKV